MANTTLFFMVSNGGSLFDDQRGSLHTYLYIGGITRVQETRTGNMINVWPLKEVVRMLNGGDPYIKIFFEVVNGEGMRLLRSVQTHADASDLVDTAMDVPDTKIYVITMEEVTTQLNAARQLKYEVVYGYMSDYNVHN